MPAYNFPIHRRKSQKNFKGPKSRVPKPIRNPSCCVHSIVCEQRSNGIRSLRTIPGRRYRRVSQTKRAFCNSYKVFPPKLTSPCPIVYGQALVRVVHCFIKSLTRTVSIAVGISDENHVVVPPQSWLGIHLKADQRFFLIHETAGAEQ